MADIPFTLSQLQIFVAVAQTGSVTAAARQHHLSQPAASQALAELERRVDIPLFERVKRRMVLTPEGEIFVGKATEILEAAHEAHRELHGAGEGVGGTLRLGASTSIGNYVLPGPLCSFYRLFPRAHVNLTVDITDQIVAGLLSGAYPLAFIEGPCQVPGVQVEKFRPDELVVVLPPGHPWAGRDVAWDEIAEKRLIIRSQGGTREVIERVLETRGLQLIPDLEFGHTEAIKTAVALGEGVSILSRLTCERELAAGVLTEARVEGLRFQRWLYRIRLHGRRTSPLSAAFLRHLDCAQPMQGGAAT